MSVKSLQRITGHGDKEKRQANDFYATPDYAIDALLNRFDQPRDFKIWEPACGDGAICKRMQARGYHNIFATDLIDRGYGDEFKDFFDYLIEPGKYDMIITNVPFKCGTKFVLRALEHKPRYVVIFNKLTFLEGKERRDDLYYQRNLRDVLVFSERVTFGGAKTGGMLAFAWYIFDTKMWGSPTLTFI